MEDYNNLFQVPRKIDFLIKLVSIEQKDEFTCTDIEKLIGYNSPQPDFRRVFKILRENNIIKEVGNKYGKKLYSIDKKQLINFIEGLRFYKLFQTYIYKTRLLYIDI